MQTLDDTIVDFTPPLPKRCVQEYDRHFVYQPVEALCYVDGCPRPLRPKDYWINKKPLPPSPTLLDARPHQTKQSPSTSVDEPFMVRRRRTRRRRRRRRQRGGFLNLLVPAMAGLGKAVALETDKRIKRTIQKANQRYRRRHR